jgi:hypothetical protein
MRFHFFFKMAGHGFVAGLLSRNGFLDSLGTVYIAARSGAHLADISRIVAGVSVISVGNISYAALPQ